MKKNMKMILRVMCAVLSACMLIGALAACGSNKNSSDPASPDSSDNNNNNNYEFDPKVDSDVAPITVNIGSYNIANGRFVDHDMSVLAKDITDQKLDIVGLQEVDMNVDRSQNMNTMKVLSELTGYQYYCFFKSINLGSGEYGLGVLSKYPIVEQERIALYSTGEERVLGRTKIDVNGTLINFFVTHLEWLPDSTRAKEFVQLNDILSQYDNFVVTGDFNVLTMDEYDALDYKGMVSTKEKPLVTYYTEDEGELTIDNILYSPDDWTFDSVAILPNGHSDHRMLRATGKFAPTGRYAVRNSDGKRIARLTDGKKSTVYGIGKWAEGTNGAYVEMDLGVASNISSLKVINATTCKNVYKWAAYATNDKTLPIDQWVKIGEKSNNDHATGAGYTAVLSEADAQKSFRYVRIYGTYNSEGEKYQLAEVEIVCKKVVDTTPNVIEGAIITSSEGRKYNSLKDLDYSKYVKVGACAEGTNGSYVEIDLNEGTYLRAIQVFHPIKGSRVYKWAAYATNDNTQSIDKWVKVAEKTGDQISTKEGYKAGVGDANQEQAFRYIRIYATYSSKDNEFHVTELAVFGITQSSLANLASSATATKGTGAACDDVIDGSTSGYVDLGWWTEIEFFDEETEPIGLNGTCYVEIDLGKLCKVDAIKVVTLISSDRVYKWQAYVTDDKNTPVTEWTALGGKTNDDVSTESGYILNLTEEQTATPIRYIRIYGTYNSANRGYHIAEIFVTGEAVK